ncbi:hypothetical protein CMI37_31030 [Candidatus Pacearchaeota archaeon]|nr:hypothetical protein [Candidatus Pacearchaeota archaeon]|tara:strand:- start:1854 stop:2174 length:321 start_codon:yes stop_codon:yes gene_type:complete
MGITRSASDVYDAVVSVSHTGDTNWTTALSVAGRGKAEIHLSCSANNTQEIRITVDGSQLYAGKIGLGGVIAAYRFVMDYNKSLLVEYRDNAGSNTVYCDIIYYNN